MKSLISNNFLEHASKVPDLTEGMTLYKLPHLTYVDSGLSCDTFNIMYIHHSELTEEELSEALEYYKSRELDYCIWTNEENLSPNVKDLFRRNAITVQASEAGMALDLSAYQFVEDVRHLNIRLVKDNEALATYANVIAENWTPKDQHVIKYYESTSQQYLNQGTGIQLFIYYLKEQPVSCVELFPTDHETVGFYGFATLEAFRGMGIGTTFLTFALNIAKDLGYKNAILQGTEDGLNIYKKFGFREYTTYYEFI